MLFAAGEDSDAMYVVLSGCLGVFAAPDRSDRRRFVGRIVAGDTVGEMGLISGAAALGHRRRPARHRARAPVARSVRPRVPRASRGDAAHRAAHRRPARIRAGAGAWRAARRAHVHDRPAEPRRGRRGLRQRAREGAEPFRPRGARVERARRRAYQPLVPSHRSANDFVVYVADPTASAGAVCACARPTR